MIGGVWSGDGEGNGRGQLVSLLPPMELVPLEWILILPSLYESQVTTSTQDSGKAVINNSDSSWCQSLGTFQGCHLPSLGTVTLFPSVRQGSCGKGRVQEYDFGLQQAPD